MRGRSQRLADVSWPVNGLAVDIFQYDYQKNINYGQLPAL